VDGIGTGVKWLGAWKINMGVCDSQHEARGAEQLLTRFSVLFEL
jgi:hypothetical protein